MRQLFTLLFLLSCFGARGQLKPLVTAGKGIVNSSLGLNGLVSVERVESGVTVYAISGGGELCDLNDNSTVTIGNSENNATYRIYNNNTRTDSVENGTGSAINFSVNDTGYVKILCKLNSDSSFTDSVHVYYCPILYYTPIAWYDASDDNYQWSTSGTVDSVLDKSGNGNSLHRVTQGTGGPTLTSDQWVFTRNSGKYLKRTAFTQGVLAMPNVIFLLCQYTDSINTQAALDSRNTSSRHTLYLTSAGFYMATGSPEGHHTPNNKSFNLHVGVFNSASSFYFLNGHKHTANTMNQSMDGITLGATFGDAASGSVKINEVIIYNLLSDLQIQEIEAYLQDKWDLPTIEYADLVTYTKNNIAYRDGDDVKMSSRFDSNEDLVTYFEKQPTNDIYTFYKEGFNNNTTNILDTLFTIDTLLMWARSDNVGPYLNYDSLMVAGGWSGGSHFYESTIKVKIDTIILGGAYPTYPTTKVILEDATLFPNSLKGLKVYDGVTDVIIGTYRYSGKSGDTLLNVTLGANYPYYIDKNDSAVLCHSTVHRSTVTYTYDNGVSLPDKTYTPFDSLKAVVHNEIYGYYTIDNEDGGGDTIFSSDVTYVFRNGEVEFEVNTHILDTVVLTYYYGLQRVSSENYWEDYVYMAKAQNNTNRLVSAGLNSGSYPTYPTDRIVFNGNNLNQSMWLDLSRGLPTQNHGFTNYSFAIPSKSYFFQVDENTRYAEEDSLYWHGGFKYFRNDLKTNSTFAYFQYEYGKLYLFVDFHAAVSETIASSKLTGKTVSTLSKSASVTAVDLTAADGDIDLSCSTTYGWIKLLIE